MTPTRISLPVTALAYSPPILHDWYQTPVGITLAMTWSSNQAGSPTASVQYTVDDLSARAYRQVASITQATTVITVAGDTGLAGPSGVPSGQNGDGGTHGLSVGDLVQIVGSGVVYTGGTPMDGWYNVATVVSTTSYTLTAPVSQTVNASPAVQVVTGRVFTHSQLVTIAGGTRAVSNYLFPVTSSRLQIAAAGSAGVVTLAVLQGGMSS
jgi:hypothetical protein